MKYPYPATFAILFLFAVALFGGNAQAKSSDQQCLSSNFSKYPELKEALEVPRVYTVPTGQPYNFGTKWLQTEKMPVYKTTKVYFYSHVEKRHCSPAYYLRPYERFIGLSKPHHRYNKIAFYNKQTKKIEVGYISSDIVASSYYNYWPYYNTKNDEAAWRKDISGYKEEAQLAFTHNYAIPVPWGENIRFKKGESIIMLESSGAPLFSAVKGGSRSWSLSGNNNFTMVVPITDYRRHMVSKQTWADSVKKLNAQQDKALKILFHSFLVFAAILLIPKQGRYLLDRIGTPFFQGLPGVAYPALGISLIMALASYLYFRADFTWEHGLQIETDIAFYIWLLIPLLVMLPYFIYLGMGMLQIATAPARAKSVVDKMYDEKKADHEHISKKIGGSDDAKHKGIYGAGVETKRANAIADMFRARANAHREHLNAAAKKTETDTRRRHRRE